MTPSLSTKWYQVGFPSLCLPSLWDARGPAVTWPTVAEDRWTFSLWGWQSVPQPRSTLQSQKLFVPKNTFLSAVLAQLCPSWDLWKDKSQDLSLVWLQSCLGFYTKPCNTSLAGIFTSMVISTSPQITKVIAVQLFPYFFILRPHSRLILVCSNFLPSHDSMWWPPTSQWNQPVPKFLSLSLLTYYLLSHPIN